MNIVLPFGAPGAGSIHRLRSSFVEYGLAHISTGDLSVKVVKAQSELALSKEYMDAGQFVPDQLVIDLVKSAFLQTMQRLVLFLTASHATRRQ